MRRVVVTGLGLVTPLASGVEPSWKRLIAAESGVRSIQTIDVSDLPSKIAGQVPIGDAANDHFNADDYVLPKDQRKMDQFIIYAMGAATQAVQDSGWLPEDEESRERTGVLIGSGIGGLQGIYEASVLLHERGPRRITPFFIPAALINLASGNVSIKFGFKGPNTSVVTACSTGAHAIGDAARLIGLEDADVMVAGGAEATICRIGIAGFAAARASRPASTTRPSAPRVPGTGPATASSWARARASSCWKSWSMPSGAAPRSMPR
jgi:3-oxoacyl-(acyl-carrier-protein) synthase